MKCPTCPDAVLVMSERQGVEIDYCPTCRGVWLDRGELDKIIERSSAEMAAAQPVSTAPPPPVPPRDERGRGDHRQEESRYEERYRREYDDDRYRGDDKYKRKKKKHSFLEDLFDF